MKEFNYSVVRTMDKDEYDKNILNFASREPIFTWLWDNIGPGGILSDENKLWDSSLEYPGPGLISVVHHFKDQEDCFMFKLTWGGG